MNTVGKEDQPGEQVRCIVSVSMLTEGWDANNVTQIVGLRAFTSQLLCEQVVGRALRRRRYDQFDENGFLVPEYADVYGVPFQVIPVRARRGGPPPPPPPSTLIRAIPDRAQFELTFPRVDGYVTELRERVVCDWQHVPRLSIAADGEPTEVYVQGVSGFRVGRPDIGGPGELERHDRVPYYLLARVQSATFRMASRILQARVAGEDAAAVARRARLFPQVLEIVRRYVAEFVELAEVPSEELSLEKWQAKIVDILGEHVGEEGAAGEPDVFPCIERFRSEGSTREVMFRTGRPCRETVRSHISHVVLDAPTWEAHAAYTLEHTDIVDCYARNDHLDFTIPYIDADGEPRVHRPDFIVRLTNGLLVALEIKGHVRELDELKIAAGYKWARAVNRYYGERRWVYHACFDPSKLVQELQTLASDS